jgi:hypothetical protein
VATANFSFSCRVNEIQSSLPLKAPLQGHRIANQDENLWTGNLNNSIMVHGFLICEDGQTLGMLHFNTFVSLKLATSFPFQPSAQQLQQPGQYGVYRFCPWVS